MTTHIEVCIDHIESLHHALKGGATRIELCSALALGGLTPSAGLMRLAGRYRALRDSTQRENTQRGLDSNAKGIPIYAMIRPRQGDFIFSEQDLECMLHDIDTAAQSGLQGVVIGALTADGKVDTHMTSQLVERAHAHQLGVTFHRAFDQCQDPDEALETIISLGCERVLTSGLALTAPEGVTVLKQLVIQARERIVIMAGAGVNASNAHELINQTGVTELHLSGKTLRPSLMRSHSQAAMGEIDDYQIPVTDPDAIAQVVKAVKCAHANTIVPNKC
ncbi:copper homeostasis protein CutC [Vibrio cholerae]